MYMVIRYIYRNANINSDLTKKMINEGDLIDK